MKTRLISVAWLALSIAVASIPFGASTVAQAGTNHWVDISSHIVSTRGTPNLSSVVFVGQEGWIGSGSLPEIYHTTDGGETFEVQTLPTEINALAMRSTLEGYAGGQNGRIYHTADGGATWDSLGTTGNPVRGLSCPPTGAACYAVGDNGSARIITGTVMTPISAGVSGHLRAVSFPIDSGQGWLCGGAIIRHFVNSAWQADQLYAGNFFTAMAFVDNLNGWAVGDNGVIAHTTVGGIYDGSPSSGWYQQVGPDPQGHTLLGVFALDAQEVWAVGDDGVIVHTVDGGQTWPVEASGLTSNILTAVHAEDRNTVYVVGNSGTLLKYTTRLPPDGSTLYLPFVKR